MSAKLSRLLGLVADGPALIGRLASTARVWWCLPFPALALAGCMHAAAPELPKLEPVPAAPTIAKVAIGVPCAVEQVPMPAYPGDLARKGDDVYTLARLAMADRRVRIAERDRLRAANSNPCPAHLETSK
jgi:hypothetical protein